MSNFDMCAEIFDMFSENPCQKMSNFDMDLAKTCQFHDRFDENQRKICILGEYLVKFSPAAQFYCQKTDFYWFDVRKKSRSKGAKKIGCQNLTCAQNQ